MDEEHCVIAVPSEVAKFYMPQINAVTTSFLYVCRPPPWWRNDAAKIHKISEIDTNKWKKTLTHCCPSRMNGRFLPFAIKRNPLRGKTITPFGICYWRKSPTGNSMVHFVGGSIERYPLRGKPNYAVRRLLLKEIPYGEIRWFISLAFAIERYPLRGKPITPFGVCYWKISPTGKSDGSFRWRLLLKGIPYGEKQITPLGICN